METTIPSYLALRQVRLNSSRTHRLLDFWWENRKDQFDIFISQFIIDEVSAGEQKQARKKIRDYWRCAA